LFHARVVKYTDAGPARTEPAICRHWRQFILLIEICRGNGSPVAASKKLDHDGAPRASAKQGKSKGKNPAVGEALRSIYQQTIDESVPQEMIDLLGKLG
jgi:hypothetical protein